jgi:hypothetical protein
MKKFLVIGGLALAVAAILGHQAWAWTNCNFSIGLNLSCQSGGNNFLWGLFRNGQPGACDLPNCPAHYYAVQHGYDADGHFQPAFPSFPDYFSVAPAPVPASQAYWYGQPAYQTVNFAPNFTGYQMNWYGR